MTPLVECQSVSFRLNGHTLISDLNFAVRRGETLVLLGKSGGGKTTTLRLINRLLVPSSGTVLVEGTATVDWDAIRLRRRIGYVIQETGLFPHFTVERNVGLVPTLLGWRRERVSDRVRQTLELVGLDPMAFLQRYPHQLSGGQRQRVGVARALAAEPPLLLMDEPFGALDPVTRVDLQQEFIRLQRTLKQTVVFVTHDVQEALVVGSRIGLMESGRLIELSEPSEFLRSERPETREFRRCLDFLQMRP